MLGLPQLPAGPSTISGTEQHAWIQPSGTADSQGVACWLLRRGAVADEDVNRLDRVPAADRVLTGRVDRSQPSPANGVDKHHLATFAHPVWASADGPIQVEAHARGVLTGKCDEYH